MELSCVKKPAVSSSGNAANFASRFGDVVVEQERVAVRRRREDARIRLQDFAVEGFELHVERNVRTERTERVCERGSVETGMKFLSDGAAADHFAAFEDQGLEAALGEIESGNESVVTAADKSHALSERHSQSAAFDAVAVEREEPPFHPLRITWLAMRPLAPMMPPPGCVAEPHI